MYKLLVTSNSENSQKENQLWTLYNELNLKLKEWEVDVLYSKSIDILSLKSSGYKEFDSKINSISRDRQTLFKDKKPLVTNCPICNSSNSKQELTIYFANYNTCNNCSHKYVVNRLSKEDLEDYYRNSSSYQSTYSNNDQAVKRVNEIQVPKLEYVIKQYFKAYGRNPRKILDIGAGSGHFGVACKLKSIDYDGVEFSKYGIDFAKDVFDIDLVDIDFINNLNDFVDKDYDVVTFWGLLEHVPDPDLMLAAGKEVLRNNPEGMIFGSVPRFNSISSIIQILFPDHVIRHLDPLGHIQMFTDTSLALLIDKCQLNLNSIWYYGMDAFELFLNVSSITKSDLLVNAEYIDVFQQFVDRNKISDSVIFSSKP